MSTLLQKIMMALGRRGVHVPVDEVLGQTYRALQQYHAAYPAVFNKGADILLAEVEGGATTIEDIPKRMGHLLQMLDRLHREEELDAWQVDEIAVAAV